MRLLEGKFREQAGCGREKPKNLGGFGKGFEATYPEGNGTGLSRFRHIHVLRENTIISD